MINIHPTAVVHETCILGPNVTIEAGVYIGPYCLIGMPAEWKGREDINAGVVIQEGSRITGLVTIDTGVERPTTIGRNCYLMKHSHVGHDAIIGDDVTIACGAKIGGHTVIGEDSNIGLNAVVHQKMKIAQGVMVGMGSVVPKALETEPFKIYAGNPAKFLRENDRHPSYTIFQQQFPCE